MQISYNNPDFDAGHEVSVANLGRLINGQTVEINDETAEAWAELQGKNLGDALSTIKHTQYYREPDPTATPSVETLAPVEVAPPPVGGSETPPPDPDEAVSN